MATGITIKIDIVATNPDGTARWESHTAYQGLAPQQELFIEKHLLNALKAMNEEGQQILAKAGK